jgi:hypothetical protein
VLLVAIIEPPRLHRRIAPTSGLRRGRSHERFSFSHEHFSF